MKERELRLVRLASRFAPGMDSLLHYRGSWFRADALAGLSIWAVLVPQSLAYGELAGLRPTAGLYTALGAGALYALFGSSKYLNVGPESSVAIVVAASIGPLAGDDPERRLELAALLALLTALLLLVGALLRLGVITRLLSTPILAGYLAGSAVIIFCSQLPKVLDAEVDADRWWDNVWGTIRQLGDANLVSAGIAGLTVAILLLLGRWAKRAPGALVVLAIATAFVAIGNLGNLQEVSTVGEVKAGAPLPGLPSIEAGDVASLLPSAASLALLIFASSALTASVLAARDKEEVESRREFIGLAAASIGSGLLQGFPANGSDSRSFIASDSGARSQVANLGAAALVLITLVVLTPVFKSVPNAALGAIIMVAAVKMIDVTGILRLYSVRRSDFVLSLLTFAGVLALGVLPGIAVGVVVSLLEVMRRAILPHTAVLGLVAGTPAYRDIENYEEAETVPGVVIFRFDAALFFANAEVLRNEIRKIVDEANRPVQMVIVNAEGIVDLDVTGAEVLGRLIDDLDQRGVRLAVARARTSLRQTLAQLGLEERIGRQNFFMRVEDAAVEFQGHLPG